MADWKLVSCVDQDYTEYTKLAAIYGLPPYTILTAACVVHKVCFRLWFSGIRIFWSCQCIYMYITKALHRGGGGGGGRQLECLLGDLIHWIHFHVGI